MSLAMPEEATRTVVCAATGDAATPSPAMSASKMAIRPAIGSSLCCYVTFATVWYVGARVNVDRGGIDADCDDRTCGAGARRDRRDGGRRRRALPASSPRRSAGVVQSGQRGDRRDDGMPLLHAAAMPHQR